MKCAKFIAIQFKEALLCQPEAGQEAVDGQVFGDVVFGVDDLQYQFSLGLSSASMSFWRAGCRRLDK